MPLQAAAVLSVLYLWSIDTRILRGLLRTHWMEMMMFAASVWGVNLLYQSTYGGMDMTMKFEWFRCVDSRENSTTWWLGGFDWEC